MAGCTADFRNNPTSRCSSPRRQGNIGVTELMDFIAQFGSSPIDRETVTATDADDKEVTVSINDRRRPILVFKTIHEDQVGELSLFRVYSGKIKPGDELTNASNGNTERIGQMYSLNGKIARHRGRSSAPATSGRWSNSSTPTPGTAFAAPVASSSCRASSIRGPTSIRRSAPNPAGTRTRSPPAWPCCTRRTRPSSTTSTASFIRR